MQAGLQASLVGRQWLALKKETKTFLTMGFFSFSGVRALFEAGKLNLAVKYL